MTETKDKEIKCNDHKEKSSNSFITVTLKLFFINSFNRLMQKKDKKKLKKLEAKTSKK